MPYSTASTFRSPSEAALAVASEARSRDHMNLFDDEEQSADAETAYANEDVAFFAIAGGSLLPDTSASV